MVVALRIVEAIDERYPKFHLITAICASGCYYSKLQTAKRPT